MDLQRTIERESVARETSRGKGHPWRRRAATLAIFALISATAIAWLMRPQQDSQQSLSRSSTDWPVTVVAGSAETADVPLSLEALGTVVPLATITVRTQINGQLTRLGFREGQHVRKGDFLAEIDPRPYQAALAQAEGQLARDQALLRNAEVDLIRYRQLVAEDSIARQTLDTQESLVRQYRATVKVDQAQVDSARLNLGYCRIVSPVEGRVGLRLVDEGNYVQTTDANGIVVVTQLQPITVVFTIPEDNLQKVLARLRAGARLPVAAYDRAGATELAAGVLATIDNQIDPTTGTVRLKAQFDNSDERLFPNQFVNIRLLVDTVRDATVIPSAAVQRGAHGTYVYVIGADATAASRPVTIGASDGERVQVIKGIEPGERVVTDGVDRLRDGIKVSIAAHAGSASGAQSPSRSGGTSMGQPAAAGRSSRPGG
jgi:multidrug efflux system membrane fusion protein